jgi:hypothetical protein
MSESLAVIVSLTLGYRSTWGLSHMREGGSGVWLNGEYGLTEYL